MIQPRTIEPDPDSRSTAATTIPMVGFVGWSGSGKTTLLAGVLPYLAKSGRRIAVFKHARDGFTVDRPGKDSHQAREAGAAQVLVASRDRWVLMAETPTGGSEPAFRSLLQRFDPREIDLVIVEGFSGEPYPKIEVYRPLHGTPPKRWPSDPWIVALATDAAVVVTPPVVRLDLNRPDLVAEYILKEFPVTPTAVRHAD